MLRSTSDSTPEGARQDGARGSQTLTRGLDVIEGVAQGASSLADLAARLGLARSTAHRLASALVERGYLAAIPRAGYRLGPRLLELGFLAQSQADLIPIARPHIEALAQASEDTVHLGVLEGDKARYLDKIAGQRRINISSRVGDLQPLTSTGLGKALILDHPRAYWDARFVADQPHADGAAWRAQMAGYVAAGRAYDLEENEDRIRCVAAPVRDAGGRIVGAISVSSAAQYMDDARMAALSRDVIATARAVSRDLGWRDTEERSDAA